MSSGKKDIVIFASEVTGSGLHTPNAGVVNANKACSGPPNTPAPIAAAAAIPTPAVYSNRIASEETASGAIESNRATTQKVTIL